MLRTLPSTSRHWAVSVIGKPWAPGAYGPDSFFCWGLVHYVMRTQCGVEMPDGELGEALIRTAVKGWERSENPVHIWDIVVMRGQQGKHVGVVINTSRGLRILHADGCMTPSGPIGSVVSQPIWQLENGMLEIWRRSP
jgi:cell wall-associated NlpC family hydrolase